MIMKERRRALISAVNSYPHGRCGEHAYWKIEDGVLILRGTGETWSFYGGYQETPWYDYTSDITEIVIEEGLTGVGRYAVSGLTVDNIYVHGTTLRGFNGTAFRTQNLYIEDVNHWASVSCAGGTNTSVSRVGNLYENGVLITHLVLNDPDLTQIRSGCFANCSSIQTVTILSPVTSIGVRSFFGCANIVLLTVPGTLRRLDANAISSSQLTRVNWGGTLSELGEVNSGTIIRSGTYYFNCQQFTFYKDGQEMTGTVLIKYNSHWFRGCANAFNAVIDSSVTQLSDYVLQKANFPSVTFSGTPASSSERAFYESTGILDIYVPWAPGAVAGEDVKWGASNATIHYNHTP